MASTPVEFKAPTGLTLTLSLYAFGSDTLANSGGADTCTERTNAKGIYTATVTEAISGWHDVKILSGSAVVATYAVFLVDDTNTHRCVELSDVYAIGGTAQTGRDIGTSVLVGDKTGFALTAAYDAAKTAAQAGDEMDLVDAPNAAAVNAIAEEVESHLLDEGDSQMLINAIVGAIGNTNIDQTVLVAAIRADLERSGGNLNTLISRLTSQRATNLDNLDAAVSTRLAGASYTAPDNSTISTINTKLGTPSVSIAADIATVDTVVDQILADTGTDGVVVAAGSKTGYALTSGERDSIAAALLDLSNGVETSLTLRGAMRLIAAASAGKLSGAGTTTITIRNVGDTKSRITATVDADGNRSSVTVDAA